MMKIEILGANCGRCKALEQAARETAARLNIKCEIVKTTDPLRFIDYNITAIPALVVDGKLVSSGRVPDASEMEGLLR